MAKFDKAATEALKGSLQACIILRMRAMRTTTLAFYMSQALVLWYGGHKVVAGTMSPRPA